MNFLFYDRAHPFGKSCFYFFDIGHQVVDKFDFIAILCWISRCTWTFFGGGGGGCNGYDLMLLSQPSAANEECTCYIW